MVRLLQIPSSKENKEYHMTSTFVLRIKTMLCCYLFLLLLQFCLPDPANAGYLDPGSGSILVQGIIATCAFFGRIVARLKSLCSFSR